MRRIFKSLILIATAAIAFVSCSKDNNLTDNPNGTVSLNFVSSSEGTRTVFGHIEGNSYPVIWNVNDKVQIFLDENYPVEASAAFGGENTAFDNVTLNGTPKDNGTIWVVYPKGVYDKNNSNNNQPGCTGISSNYKQFYIYLPDVQTPVTGSCDPKAQVLYAEKSYAKAELASGATIDLGAFHHATAYGNTIIKGVKDGEKISTVTLTFPQNVAGTTCYFNYEKYNSLEKYNLDAAKSSKNTNTITLNVGNVTGNSYLFGIAPFSCKGKSISVVVTTTNGATYTKTVSVPSSGAQAFDFEQGKVTKFTVSVESSSTGGDGEDDLNTPDGHLETPYYGANTSMLKTIFHYATLNGREVRNYALNFDLDNKIANWVAYPLTKEYTAKNTDRTDDFKADPLLPAKSQISYTMSGYSRGHQIASADRLGSRELNVQTFYYSNMTPQLQNGFNGGIWGSLEDKVRGYISSYDTVYVVTGAVLKTVGGVESVKYVTDKKGVSHIAVPNYYYKVVVGMKKSGSTATYKGIGFWLEHKNYDTKAKISRTYACSIDDIEKKTGVNFFVNLPKTVEAQVESTCNPSEWGL